MRRFNAAVLALVLVAVMVGGVPRRSAAQEATPATTVGAKPQQPVQPATGPGSSEALFGGMTVIEQIPAGEIEPDYWLFVPRDPLPGTTSAAEPLPLVIFGHSYTLRDAVVVYAEYQADATDDAVYRQNFLNDVRSALATLEREGVAVDLERVAVTGHSVGGVLAADYAASAAAEELPVPAAVMSIAPGCLQDLACLVADLAMVPSTTRVLLVIDADDSDPSGGGPLRASGRDCAPCRWSSGIS